MLSWLFYALLAPAIISVVSFIDKYLLEKEVKDYRGMPIYGSIMAFIFGTCFWIISGFPIINTQDTILILISGMLSIWASAFYFKIIAKEEASRVLILLQMIPLIVLLLSVLFLKETITLTQLLGFVLILLGTLGVTLKKDDLSFKLSQSFLFMFLACFCWAAASVVFKFVVDNHSFIKIVSFESLGMAIGGAILYFGFPSIKKAFLQTTKSVRKRTLGLLFMNEGFYVVSRLSGFLAISLGSVSLVSVIGGTSVFFGIAYGWLLTLFAPHILKENIAKKELIKKICLAFLVFIGILLVT